MTYAEFFRRATGHDPYAYQSRLAGGEDAHPQGAFEHGRPCRSQLIHIPTDLGKTAAEVVVQS